MRIATIFTVAFLSCSSAGAAELDGSQLRGTLVGQTIQWWEANGWYAGHLILLPDGRAEISVSSPTTRSDAGYWRIEGNRICTIWSAMRSGQSKCYSVNQISPNRFTTSGGNVFELQTAGA
jgi:hypothetical protein